MRKVKFIIPLFMVMIGLLGLFVEKSAEAAGPESCSVGCYTVSINKVSSSENPNGNWPFVIIDNNADTANYCGNTDVNNYPCTVFRYRATPNQGCNTGYQKATLTYPICPDAQSPLKIGTAPGHPHELYSPCNPPNPIQNWTDNVCGTKAIYFTDLGAGSGTRDFHVAVGPVFGKTIGVGVVSAFLGDQKGWERCITTQNNEVVGGILGPGCPQAICNQGIVKANTLCTSFEGSNILIELANGEPSKVYDCGTDTTCSPASCKERTDGIPFTDLCVYLEKNPTHCFNMAEIGTLSGNTNTQTGYVVFADSPGCQTIGPVGGKIYTIPAGCSP